MDPADGLVGHCRTPYLSAFFLGGQIMLARSLRRGARDQERRRVIAYHESGHALAFYLLHQRFRHVTIEPNAISLGHVHAPLRIRDDQLSSISPLVRDRLERRIVSLLAAREAQRLVTGRYSHTDARADLKAASELTFFRIVDPDETGRAYFRWLRLRARQLVTANRPLLDALAAALLDRGTLNRAEAIEIFEIARGLPSHARSKSLRQQLSNSVV